LPARFNELAGKPCPNNPYYAHADLYDDYLRYADALAMSRDLLDMAELSRMDHAEISPCEWTAVRILRQHGQQEQHRLMAMLLNPKNYGHKT
jgi:hypothetical protein